MGLRFQSFSMAFHVSYSSSQDALEVFIARALGTGGVSLSFRLQCI